MVRLQHWKKTSIKVPTVMDEVAWSV